MNNNSNKNIKVPLKDGIADRVPATNKCVVRVLATNTNAQPESLTNDADSRQQRWNAVTEEWIVMYSSLVVTACKKGKKHLLPEKPSVAIEYMTVEEEILKHNESSNPWKHENMGKK